jgi:hypothetical protein
MRLSCSIGHLTENGYAQRYANGISANQQYKTVHAEWRTGNPPRQYKTTQKVSRATGSKDADLVSDGLEREGKPHAFERGLIHHPDLRSR